MPTPPPHLGGCVGGVGDRVSDPAVEAAERAAATAEYTGRGLVIAAAREALAPIRELHRPWTIYAECDHQLDDDPHEIGNEHPDSLHHYEYEIGWTCEVMYKVCAECCVDDVYQSEDCANYHDHGPGKPICPTARLVYTTEELENR